MALTRQGTHFGVKAGSKRTSSHMFTFRPTEQHLSWRLEGSSAGQDGDSFLGTKEPHSAGASAFHMSVILGWGRRKVASASPQGDPIPDSILGTGKVTTRRHNCSGQVFRSARSSPTAQVLLLYLICLLSQDLLRKRMVERILS